LRDAALHWLNYIQPNKQCKLGDHGDSQERVDEDYEIIIGETALRKLSSRWFDWLIRFSNATLHDGRATLAVAQMRDAISEICELGHSFKIANIRGLARLEESLKL
jgi:hypothetical protein